MPIHGTVDINRARAILNKDLRAVYAGGLKPIVEQTPAVTGEARNGWFLTKGSPSKSTRGANFSGAGSLSQIDKIPLDVLGKKLYFTNNTAQIIPLEYGGYPNPVKDGSWDKETQSYVKLSEGGYSKQLQGANGWVRINLRKMIRVLANL